MEVKSKTEQPAENTNFARGQVLLIYIAVFLFLFDREFRLCLTWLSHTQKFFPSGNELRIIWTRWSHFQHWIKANVKAATCREKTQTQNKNMGLRTVPQARLKPKNAMFKSRRKLCATERVDAFTGLFANPTRKSPVQKLLVPQLVKKFPSVQVNRLFTNVFLQ